MKIYGLAFTVTLCLIFSRIDSSIIHGLKLQENTNTEKTPRKSIEIIREEDEDEGGVASVALLCGAPRNITCGTYDNIDRHYGAKLTVKCDDGCELVGSPIIQCLPVPDPFHHRVIWQSNGAWPQCRPVAHTSFESLTCKAPPNMTCGSYIGADYSIGATLTVVCDPECTLSGPDTIHCIGVPDPFRHVVIWDSFTGKLPVCQRPTAQRSLNSVYSNFVKAPEIIAVSETMDEPPSPPFRTSDGAPFAIDQIKGDFHEHEKDITCLRNKKICSLEPDTGRCKAAFPRYYYDFEQKECIPFIYGGCMGNENNFKTLEECQKKCYC